MENKKECGGANVQDLWRVHSRLMDSRFFRTDLALVFAVIHRVRAKANWSLLFEKTAEYHMAGRIGFPTNIGEEWTREELVRRNQFGMEDWA